MSERRTELIRVRLTPSEKARWEAAAVREDVAVSELIRSAVEQRMSLNDRLGSLVSRRGCEHPLACRQSEGCSCGYDAELVGISSEQTSPDAVISNIVEVEPEAAAKLRETFGPKAKDVDVDCNVYNTTRDNERCPHGSPPWAFCGTCFEAGVTR